MSFVPPLARVQQVLGDVQQVCEEKMARMPWKYALLAFSSLASSQSSGAADGVTITGGSRTQSIATATLDGSPTTYSVAFTVPASADTGPNLLPNIYDPNAKQAQGLCPGYMASNVQNTEHGFTASLTLAGEPVRLERFEIRSTSANESSAMSTEPTSRTSPSLSTCRIPIACGFR